MDVMRDVFDSLSGGGEREKQRTYFIGNRNYALPVIM